MASGKLKVELYSSQRALELIGKAHALFTEKIKVEDVRIIVERKDYKGRSTDFDPEAEGD